MYFEYLDKYKTMLDSSPTPSLKREGAMILAVKKSLSF